MKSTLKVVMLVSGIVLASGGMARAVCPDTLCDCLGAAVSFDGLANGTLTVKYGKRSVSGSSYRTETDVAGAVCGQIATLTGDAEEGPVSVGDVVGRAASPLTAIKFKGVRVSGIVDPGVEVGGVVATGGGLVANPQLV